MNVKPGDMVRRKNGKFYVMGDEGKVRRYEKGIGGYKHRLWGDASWRKVKPKTARKLLAQEYCHPDN